MKRQGMLSRCIATVAAVFAGASALAAADVQVIAQGLNNPRGIALAPNGWLYVAETGTGGDGGCQPNPEPGQPPRCYGESGALTRIEQFILFETLSQIDTLEYRMPVHRSDFPYAGGTPCTLRGTGLFIKIRGEAHDCPGELHALGNVRTESLATIWERVRPITQGFDGGCAPREAFWKRIASGQ